LLVWVLLLLLLVWVLVLVVWVMHVLLLQTLCMGLRVVWVVHVRGVWCVCSRGTLYWGTLLVLLLSLALAVLPQVAQHVAFQAQGIRLQLLQLLPQGLVELQARRTSC